MSQTGSVNGTTSVFASAASGNNPAASSSQKGSAGLGEAGGAAGGGAGREADRRTESGSRAGSRAEGDVRGAYRAGAVAGSAAGGAGGVVGGPVALAAGVRGADRVEVSSMALYLSKLQQLPAIREDLVARVRAEIEAGTYDTDDKIGAAFGEALREVAE